MATTTQIANFESSTFDKSKKSSPVLALTSKIQLDGNVEKKIFAVTENYLFGGQCFASAGIFLYFACKLSDVKSAEYALLSLTATFALLGAYEFSKVPRNKRSLDDARQLAKAAGDRPDMTTNGPALK